MNSSIQKTEPNSEEKEEEKTMGLNQLKVRMDEKLKRLNEVFNKTVKNFNLEGEKSGLNIVNDTITSDINGSTLRADETGLNPLPSKLVERLQSEDVVFSQIDKLNFDKKPDYIDKKREELDYLHINTSNDDQKLDRSYSNEIQNVDSSNHNKISDKFEHVETIEDISKIHGETNDRHTLNYHLHHKYNSTDNYNETLDLPEGTIPIDKSASEESQDGDSQTELDKEVIDDIVLDSQKLFSVVSTQVKDEVKVNDEKAHHNFGVDEELMHKIEESEREKEEEAKRAMDEIHDIESKMKLDQRVFNKVWQIRKNAYKEIADLLHFLCADNSSYGISEAERVQAFENFFPWLKSFIDDLNSTALVEGLNTFFVFITYSSDYRKQAMAVFFSKLEKILAHSNTHIPSLCNKIIQFAIKDLTNYMFGEIISKLSSMNNKTLQFITKLLGDMLLESDEGLALFTDNVLKKLLTESVKIMLSKAKNSVERKKIISPLIRAIYSVTMDDIETIKSNIGIIPKNNSDLEKILKNCEKLNFFKKFTLYGDLNALNTLNQSARDNKQSTNDDVETVSDIFNNQFYDIPHNSQLDSKRKIMESVNSRLSNCKQLKESDKDMEKVLPVLNTIIEDSNILLHTEGIKCLKYLSKLCNIGIKKSKLKLILLSSFDKVNLIQI